MPYIYLVFLTVLFVNNAKGLECDVELSNTISQICYSNEHKSALKVDYVLMVEYINTNNIKKRPGFRIDPRLNRKFASSSRDYRNSGYDRGHIMPDASTDHEWMILSQSYLMSNIVPQTRSANRKHLFSIEKEERKLVEKDGMLLVTNYIFFSDNPDKLEHGQSVPSHFGKKLTNIRGEKCYKVTNDKESKTIMLECTRLINEFNKINNNRTK